VTDDETHLNGEDDDDQQSDNNINQIGVDDKQPSDGIVDDDDVAMDSSVVGMIQDVTTSLVFHTTISGV